MKAIRKALIAASVGAIVAVVGGTAAMADPVFTADPTSLVAGGAPFQASDFSYSSNATIVQTGATTQTETGYAYVTGVTNNGAVISTTTSRLVSPALYGLIPNTYGLYFTFTATISGVTGFGSGAGIGTVTGFNFGLYADTNEDDTFNAGTCGSTSCSAASVTGTGNDILLASGSVLSGSAGFQAATGAPILSAVDTFTVNDPGYFTAPVPFYNLVFTSTTASSLANVTVAGNGSAATINGINGGTNFVPEPLTLSLFGAGLVGAGFMRRRKSKKA